MDALIRFFQKLPESTNSWRCRWFLSIMYACAVLGVIGYAIIPGFLGWVSLAVAIVGAVAALVSREDQEEC